MIHRNPLVNGFLLRKQANSHVDRMPSAENVGIAFAKASRADWCIWMLCTLGMKSLRTSFYCQGQVCRKRRRKPLVQWRTVRVWSLNAILPQNGTGKLLLHLHPSCSAQRGGVQFCSLLYGVFKQTCTLGRLRKRAHVCVAVGRACVRVPPSRICKHLDIYYDLREGKLHLEPMLYWPSFPSTKFLPLMTVHKATVIMAESKYSYTLSLGPLVELFSSTCFEMSCGHLTCFVN